MAGLYNHTQNIGTRINRNSKLTGLLRYITIFGPTTKYELLINVLDYKGTRQELRGIYSVNFQSYRDNGLMVLNETTHEYAITALGLERLAVALKKAPKKLTTF